MPFREFDENTETYAVEPIIRCDTDGRITGLRFSNQLMQAIGVAVQRPIVKSIHVVRQAAQVQVEHGGLAVVLVAGIGCSASPV